jgi:hypothetical protein
MKAKTAKRLLKRAVEEIPDNLELIYVDRDDELSAEQIAKLLGGQTDEVVESINGIYADHQNDTIDQMLSEAIPDEDVRDAFADTSQYEDYRQACWDADKSDPYTELVKKTYAQLIRVHFRDKDNPVELEDGSWSWDADKTAAEAKRIASVAGLDFDANRDALIELVENATGGGELCVIYYTQLVELEKAVGHLVRSHHQVENPDTSRVKITFSGKVNLLVLDKNSGSGHDVTVNGNVTVEFGYKDLDQYSGVLQLDSEENIGGYSWKSVADPYPPAYKLEPKIELL